MDPALPSDAIQVQSKLIFWGYLSGPADGKWGPASRRALQDFRDRNGILSTEPWDEASERLLFGSEGQVKRLAPVLFAGSWTDEPGICGADGEPPPLKLTAHSAHNSTGDSCTFGPLQPDGPNAWRTTAKCKVNGSQNVSSVRLSLNGSILSWTSDKNPPSNFYRCN